MRPGLRQRSLRLGRRRRRFRRRRSPAGSCARRFRRRRRRWFRRRWNWRLWSSLGFFGRRRSCWVRLLRLRRFFSVLIVFLFSHFFVYLGLLPPRKSPLLFFPWEG